MKLTHLFLIVAILYFAIHISIGWTLIDDRAVKAVEVMRNGK